MKQILSRSLLILLLAGLMSLTAGGCRQKMAEQPDSRPLSGPLREPPAGTVARDALELDTLFYQGMKELTPEDKYMANLVKPDGTKQVIPTLEQIGQFPYVEEIPMEMDEALLARGKVRYTVFCAVCHDDAGTGRGVVVEKGFTEATTFHSQRLSKAPPGYFFDVITHGLGPMPSYRHQVPVKDRWAIIAYVRELQKNPPQGAVNEASSEGSSPESGGTSVD